MAPAEQAVDEHVARHVQPREPGAAVLVVVGEVVQYQKGFGLADVEHRVPITPATLFELASVSKPFTAQAVMILADLGRLHFSDDVRLYLPDLHVEGGHRPIRLTDLLWHTSGLPDYLPLLPGAPDDVWARLTNQDIPALLRRATLDVPPGIRYQYSNTNYALLALIVERLSGRPFADFMREEIFEPLGMAQTRVMERIDQDLPGRARGYELADGHVVLAEQLNRIAGDGNVWSNLEDLACWDFALRSGALLRPHTLAQAHTAGRTDEGEAIGYGFGWHMQPYRGRLCFDHGGGWGGFRSYYGRYASGGLTVVVLMNQGNADAEALADAVADVYLDGLH
jgi:CubicO group peptidase (beta-lactamase class C family)